MKTLVKLAWPQWVFDEANALLDQLNWEDTTPSRNAALRFTTLAPSDIKVIILGQDPYPSRGVANGLAFATNLNQPLPASLKTLFREIGAIQGAVFADQTLMSWVEQGVLLLNTALTTQIGVPRAHRELWAIYMERLIKWLDNELTNITWVLWGKDAAELGLNLKNKVLFDAHPSPLSARLRRGEPFQSITFIKW